jgi:hypothetical protein
MISTGAVDPLALVGSVALGDRFGRRACREFADSEDDKDSAKPDSVGLSNPLFLLDLTDAPPLKSLSTSESQLVTMLLVLALLEAALALRFLTIESARKLNMVCQAKIHVSDLIFKEKKQA